ncbi:glycoside hydrolase family 18 [Rhizosphaericola mali]|uniref:GH18 domain-containing protein n=1 Tax=Rhizosphaericola mali TaxID=2545455 RepID=A0A5P2FZM6_9BACT|nr:glycoside hydrolase family 18 [Rhizosphaericola mali]QES88675.1 hypothetical protein E0W69_008415 [Rhizosphaericola mali]
MKYLGIILSAIGLMIIINSCSKSWTDYSALQVQNLNQDSNTALNNKTYQTYLANLRSYKSSKHSIVMGWIEWGDKTSTANSTLNDLPDSLDFISILNPSNTLSDEKKQDLSSVQKNKGTKVLYNLNLQNWDDSLYSTFNKIGYLLNVDSAFQSQLDSVILAINSLGYDGVDVNVEGMNCSSCGSFFYTYQTGYYNRILDTLGKLYGPHSNTEKFLLVEGATTASLLSGTESYFNYYIANTNDYSWYYQVDNAYATIAQIPGFTNDKLIITTDFNDKSVSADISDKLWQYGGIPFYTNGSGTPIPSSTALLNWNPTSGLKGGMGIFYINYDYFNNDFTITKNIIKTLNPSGE